MAHEYHVIQKNGRYWSQTFFKMEDAQKTADAIGGTVTMDNRFYSGINNSIKVNTFDVIDYFSVNRHEFDGLTFPEAFHKLYEECKTFLNIRTDDDFDELATAVDVCLTLEQRRMNSYSQGNTHIEDYVPKLPVKKWQDYL